MSALAPERIPQCDMSDPASLEAFYGPFGVGEHLRKIVLSNCAEIVRARAVAEETKISEARVNDLAHIHDFYLDFTIQSVQGRTLRSQNVIDSLQQGVGR